MEKLNELAMLGEAIIQEAWAKLSESEDVTEPITNLEEVDRLRPDEAFFLGVSIANFLHSNENQKVSNEILDQAMLKVGVVDITEYLN